MTQVPDVKMTAPNHCIITVDNVTYFKSYNSIVAKCEKGQYTVGKDWDYSKTTVRHLLADFIPSYIAADSKELKLRVNRGDIHYDPSLI